MKLHPGIRIHNIPVRGGPGLIFALGVLAILLLGVPETREFLVLGVAGGLVVAVALHWWRNR